MMETHQTPAPAATSDDGKEINGFEELELDYSVPYLFHLSSAGRQYSVINSCVRNRPGQATRNDGDVPDLPAELVTHSL